MIPVVLAQEPKRFDETVRQQGLAAIDELVGRASTSYRVVRGAMAPKAQHPKIDVTLPLLNIRDCCAQRRRYVEEYRRGPGAKGIDLAYLEHRAPFIAAELRRQGQLVRGDA